MSSSSSPDPSPVPVVIEACTPNKEVEETAKKVAIQEQAEEAAHPDQPKKNLLWYFAIGSMMNPTSMNLRNLFPHKSIPGILKGWKLVFRGGGGMGDIDESPEDSFHGILHLVTEEEFKHLDAIESIYKRTPVKVTTYDGEIIEAGAYKMDLTKLDPTVPHALPGERYLDIIIRGAIHYGVAPEYIEFLKTIPVQPRKKPSEYRYVPIPPDVTYSQKELSAHNGADGSELWISINGKIMKFWNTDDPNPSVKYSYEWAKSRYGGTEISVAVAKVLYEPLYPIPTTYEEMPLDCRRWAEELFFSFSREKQWPLPEGCKRMANWESIGWLEGYRGDR